MTECGGIESIEVEVQVTADEDYEALLTKAMSRVMEFLPDVVIRRSYDECVGEIEQWFIGCAHCGLSPGGSGLGGSVTFVRYTR